MRMCMLRVRVHVHVHVHVACACCVCMLRVHVHVHVQCMHRLYSRLHHLHIRLQDTEGLPASSTYGCRLLHTHMRIRLQDTEDFPFIEYTVVVKLTADPPAEPHSAMRLVVRTT